MPSTPNTTIIKRSEWRATQTPRTSVSPTVSWRASIIPDLNPGDKSAENRFKDVQEAYDVLSDKKKRQMYDQVGFYSENGAPTGGQGFGGSRTRSNSPRTWTSTDSTSRSFTAAEHGTADHAASVPAVLSRHVQPFFRSGQRRTTSSRRRGPISSTAINIDFWQSIKGTQAKIEVTRHEICVTCNGSGQAGGGSVTCPQCNGTGQVPRWPER